MRLSSVGLAAPHFTLALAVILLFSPITVAQHSGGGGSSGGGSASAGSGGGGGGSHGGASGGGSASSGGGHSFGGSSSHSSGSASNSSTGHSSSAGAASSHSGTAHSGTSQSNTVHSTHQPRTGVRGTAQPSQKRGFFSFLRHPVRRPEPTPPEPKPKPTELVAKVRLPICFKAPCPVCPAGQVHGGSGCEGTILRDRIRSFCRAGEYWANGGCQQQTWYQDDCGGLRIMMERQAQRMQAAEQERQIACSTGPRDQCTDLTSRAESEAGFYRELQNRYQACQRRSPTALPFRGFRIPGYSAGLSFDSLSLGLAH